MEESEARGEARGREEEARRIVLRVLEQRFGIVPERLTERIAGSSSEWRNLVLDRALAVESYEEFQAGL